ncbi:hypothetical protein G6O69_10805 [Pseudenhygromyxa sp. WMMC2535]|uniref:hypothetical protein n=1 Tax=Pseudenhygromyxa sp. WMMC2535 TaxID=2712867 RepID=UPI0015535C78|nr:hypothetical protein [Pseudenhygromyxa sp. WMMC2535]NVB38321.1 hypothetical protein [Pseudenhygromyxa sp. WMMC2535]
MRRVLAAASVLPATASALPATASALPATASALPAALALATASALATGLGCSDEISACDLDSSAIAMRATITDDGERVEVQIVLEVGNDGAEGTATQLSLCEADALSVNGETTELERALGQRYYTVEFDERADSYSIELERSGYDPAVATVEMPPELEILAPAEGSEHPRSEPLEFSWSPIWEGHTLELAVEDEIGSSCIVGLGLEYEVDDTGSYVVPADALLNTLPSQSTCDVWAALTRTAEGDYPEQLHASGSVIATVKRRHRFSSST